MTSRVKHAKSALSKFQEATVAGVRDMMTSWAPLTLCANIAAPARITMKRLPSCTRRPWSGERLPVEAFDTLLCGVAAPIACPRSSSVIKISSPRHSNPSSPQATQSGTVAAGYRSSVSAPKVWCRDCVAPLSSLALADPRDRCRATSHWSASATGRKETPTSPVGTFVAAETVRRKPVHH